MSLNHFSSDLPETLWWTTQQLPTMELPSPKTLISPLYHHNPPHNTIYRPHNSTFNFNLNQEDDNDDDQLEEFLQENNNNNKEEDQEEPPKEPMFEKPLTPSDVGKLNRLVIPKQHAEKYFPLGGDSVEKGLLLSFEDELGKSWRFRYSYWNSSQSYVLTKGWSRFVKEKRLDAGDVVLFERHRTSGDRLFIGWRRRTVAIPHDSGGLVAQGAVTVAAGGGGNSAWTRLFYNAQAYPTHPGVGVVGNGPCIPYQPDYLHAGSNVHNKSPTRTPIRGNAKRSVRLFGVNLECEAEEDEPATPDGSSISSPGQDQGQGQAHYQYFSTSNHHHQHHMDMNMCGDVNQMRYQYEFHQG